MASSSVGRIFVQHPSQGEPTLAITPDPVTLNELYDIDPPDGIARNEAFDNAAAEFLSVVDLASTWNKKKAKALIEDFRKTLVEVRVITQIEIATMEKLRATKINPGVGEQKLQISMLFRNFAERMILKNCTKETYIALITNG